MRMIINIEYSGWIAGIPQRHLRRMLRTAHQQTGRWFASQMLPLRFTSQGGRKLGYAKRHGEAGAMRGTRQWRRTYVARKMRQYGHREPMVFTGQSKFQSKLSTLSATFKGWTVKIRAPRIARRKPSKKSPVDPREEITRVADSEWKQLIRLFQNVLMRQLNGFRRKRRVRISG